MKEHYSIFSKANQYYNTRQVDKESSRDTKRKSHDKSWHRYKFSLTKLDCFNIPSVTWLCWI